MLNKYPSEIKPHPVYFVNDNHYHSHHNNNAPLDTSVKKITSSLLASAGASASLFAMLGSPQAMADTTNQEQILKPVIVNETREADSYQGGKTRIGKTNQLAKDIPQSVTIVNEQLIQDRNAFTFKEALRNVAGLTFNAGEGGRIGDNITLRGYSAVGDLYLDGLRDIAQYNRETFNLEQIDVLRGSASMLYGRGSTGGIVNQVSKTPKQVDSYKADVTLGSDNFQRLTVDLNKAVTEDVAIRLNAMDTDSDSYRNGVSQQRQGVAPSISWGGGTDNEVVLSYYYLNEDNVPDYGVPYFQGKPLPVPVDRFYGMSNADYERNKTGIGTLTYTHQFDNDSSIRTTLRQADYDRDLRATAPRLAGSPSVITDSTAITRQRQARGSTEHTLTGQTEYAGKHTLLDMKHEILAGAEVLRESAERWTNSSALSNPGTSVGNTNTTAVLPTNFDASFSRTNLNDYEGKTYSAYFQDTIEFVPNWKVLLGARFDSMRADYNRPAPAGPLSRRDDVWSYRSGLMYQPNSNSSYYISYGTSFNPSAELYQLDDRSQNTPPEKSRNLEIGSKWELMEGDLSLRTALFRSEKTNERNTDVASSDIYLLSGRRHTDGVELEAAGRLTKAWQVFASLAAMRAEVDEASGSQANTKGKVPVNTPNHTFSLWTTYKVDDNWRGGIGVEGVGRRFANATNTIEIDGYRRVDALIEYATKHYSAKLNFFNLFNTQYYESIYTGHVVPGTTRAAQLTLGIKY